MKMAERIIVDPNICHGQETIKGTRIMVGNVLSLLAGGTLLHRCCSTTVN